MNVILTREALEDVIGIITGDLPARAYEPTQARLLELFTTLRALALAHRDGWDALRLTELTDNDDRITRIGGTSHVDHDLQHLYPHPGIVTVVLKTVIKDCDKEVAV